MCETRKYLCPCCKVTMVDAMHNAVCYYCGWDDVMQDRSDDEAYNSGINPVVLSKAREMVNQGKNIFGGEIPWKSID